MSGALDRPTAASTRKLAIAKGFKVSSHLFDDARDASVNGGSRAPAVVAQ